MKLVKYILKLNQDSNSVLFTTKSALFLMVVTLWVLDLSHSGGFQTALVSAQTSEDGFRWK